MKSKPEEKRRGKFVKIIPSKKIDWINDIYYGTKGLQQKGHLVASGAIVVLEPIIKKGTLQNCQIEQPLYHRNEEGKVLLDTGIRR